MTYSNPEELKEAIAKVLGVTPDKVAFFDQNGNERDKVTPVFSPTLAFLLCAVHKLNIINVRTNNGEPFATFKACKTVDDATRLWYALTDHYDYGGHMPIQELIDQYLRHQVNKKNNHKLGQLWKLRKPFVKEHFKDCKDCKDCSPNDKSI